MEVFEVYQTNPFEDGQGGGVKYVSILTRQIVLDKQVNKVIFLGQGLQKINKGKIEFVPVVRGNTKYVFFALKLFWFAFSFRRLRGRVVHVHRLYFGLPFSLLRLINGCKVVCTMHGRTFEVFKEGRSVFVVKITSFFFRMIERLAILLTDYMVPVSQDVVNCFEKKYPGFVDKNKNKMKVLPSMVDLSRFDDEDKGLRGSQVNSFCFIGRLSAVKDFSFLIKLIRNNREELRGQNFRLDVVGDGEDREKLFGLIHQEKIEDLVVLHGAKNSDEVVSYYKTSLATILCSKHEAAPTVVVESIAANTPVISNDVGDVRAILSNEGVGLLVKKTEVSYLNAITLMIKGFEFDKEKARKILETRTPEFVANAYIRVFKELVSK